MQLVAKLLSSIIIINTLFVNYSFGEENITTNSNDITPPIAYEEQIGEDVLEENIHIIEESDTSNLKSSSIMCIDSPSGIINDENIEVRGWSLNSSGVSQVKIYVDGVYFGNANIGGFRPDVNDAHPGYLGGENSGYSYTIDKNKISPGNHKIRVESIGTDGSIDTRETIIEMKKGTGLVCIDSPSGTINNEDIEVIGWSLNPSGVSQVKVYVDGIYYGDAAIGGSRPDVNAAYPGYPGGVNSGYSYAIDKSKVSPGTHTIKVESIGVDKSKYSSEVSIEMKKGTGLVCVDSPSGTINNEDIEVRGWSLNPSGVSQVKVYVDGAYHGNAATGGSRPDVNAAYPGYPGGANSGYSYIIDKNTISPGTHIIKVESIGVDGSKYLIETSILIKKPNAKIHIDTPSNSFNKKESSYMEIRGWALNASGVKSVNIYMNNKFMGSATTGGSRPDVNAAYPGYTNGENSGYQLIVPTVNLITGVYNIKVVVTGNDGSVSSIEQVCRVNNGVIVIDPGHGGKDSGAVGSGFKEKDLNIEISLATANYLVVNGYDVVMTRTSEIPSNTKLELAERSSLSNTLDASLFVSIHNDTSEGNGNGAHAIYSIKDKNGGPSKTLAQNILNSIASNTVQNIATRGAWTRTLDDGRDYYHVIREVKATSVIIECSYMNLTDIQAVNTPAKRIKMGEAIAKGIIKTIG
ncbi:N-acetylmuramoyl-L-alanine amidase [Romboutsia sp. 1001713B170207_170306_H8]|uniref:N-acetylmuramoyl-L-alanine amidase n=1 Tax=Romboutsia sp. 1001713B170207_170306_H8 TaxID=2787112 RepID=UPI000821B62D|nr:N-acetylmuramoyl-L-alanine amidase [Romboutsia sp. 1001713B170207_170306_H8]SCH20641.1 N-acetylmuramoyl-L-alanine amidase LytC precursor [uncultured Clostridium sp.]